LGFVRVDCSGRCLFLAWDLGFFSGIIGGRQTAAVNNCTPFSTERNMTRTSFIVEIHQLVLPNKIDQPYLYLRSFPIRASLFSKYRTIPTLFLANAPCAIGAPTLTKSGNWPSEEKLRRQASPNLKTPTLHCFWATSETVPRALPTFHP